MEEYVVVKTQEKVLASFRKAADLDTHVRIVTVDGLRVVEVRDYVPSLKEYGRGYWFPSDGQSLNQIVAALLKVMNEEGT